MNEIAVVTEQDIPDILRMIHEIYSELPNKEWFSLDSDEEVTSYMMTGGFGLKAMCDGRLAGDYISLQKILLFIPPYFSLVITCSYCNFRNVFTLATLSGCAVPSR